MRKLYLTGILLLIGHLVAWAQPGLSERPTEASVLEMIEEAKQKPTDKGLELLEMAARASREVDFVDGEMLAYLEMAMSYREKQDIGGELRARLWLLNLQDEHSDSLTRALGWQSLGVWYLEQGIPSKAEDVFRNAVEIAGKKAPEVAFQANRGAGLAASRQGKTVDAGRFFQAALDNEVARDNLLDQLWLRQQLARLAHDRGDFNKELEISHRVRVLAENLGQKRIAIAAVNNMGYANLFLARPDSAAALFKQVLGELESYPDLEMESDARLNLGIIQHNQGKLPEAIENFEEVVKIGESIDRPRQKVEAFDYLARIYLRGSDAYSALTYNDEAIRIARKENLPQLLMTSYDTRSKIQSSIFEFEEVLDSREKFIYLRDSIELAQQKRKQNALQEQVLAERMEKELKLIWVNEEMQEIEIERLNALRERDAEEKKRLGKESEIKTVQLQNKDLQAMKIRDSLALSEQRRRVQLQQADIQNLDNQRRIQELKLEEERLLAVEKESEINLLEKENQIQELENQQQLLENEGQKSSIRNLFYLVLGLGGLILLILLGLWTLRKKNRKIQGQQLLIAAEKEKSDQLLLNILPVQVAEELKEKGHSRPKSYDAVSVVFTDFSGFTMISEQLSPAELIEKLDAIFLEFDLIVERNGLQRIKTIGDAYMCACGLPELDAEHALKAVQAALEMRDFIQRFNEELAAGLPKWNIRIGVHSGPVVAGVVGIRKFAYDIWGDTVNTASRMESSGEVGKVNVSGTTHQLVKGQFHAEHRGKIYAKNKGEIDMYFVESGQK